MKTSVTGVDVVFIRQKLKTVLLLSVVLLPACGGEPAPERAVVTGTVTWKGEPLKEGRIEVSPKAGHTARANAADIVDGQYTIGSKGGVDIGEFDVKITAYNTKKIGPTADDPEVYEIRDQYLPAKYNKNSTLSLTVSSGDEKIEQDFKLE